MQSGTTGFERWSAHAWTHAILWFGLGDLVTSLVGLRFDLAREAIPGNAVLLAEFGLAAALPIKIAAFAIAYAGWKATPRPYGIAIPICIAVIGLYLTARNAFIILAALGVL